MWFELASFTQGHFKGVLDKFRRKTEMQVAVVHLNFSFLAHVTYSEQNLIGPRCDRQIIFFSLTSRFQILNFDAWILNLSNFDFWPDLNFSIQFNLIFFVSLWTPSHKNNKRNQVFEMVFTWNGVLWISKKWKPHQWFSK